MKTILLVEDDQFLGPLLKTRLEKEGFTVLMAKTGNEALEELKTAAPDLILMDIILPGISGFETMEEIAKDPVHAKTPVIIISNLGQESDIARGKELGAIDYYVKANMPIDDLISKIKTFLNI